MSTFRCSRALASRGLRQAYGVPVRRLATVAEAPKKAVSFKIPVVDFSRFQHAQSDAEKLDSAKELVHGFKEAGFVYLDKHSIPAEVVRDTFAMSKTFFELPMETKLRLSWKDPRSNRGYVAPGRELVTQSKSAEEIAKLRKSKPDYKESHEIGREWDEVWRNEWPTEAELPGYRTTMLSFFRTCHELHVSVMRSLALGLDLPEHWFDDKVNEQCHNLRTLWYPSIPTKLLRTGGHRAGAHSDYGTVTLLFQDQVGGLEVQNPHTGSYVQATPIEGTIVVNAGDLLSRWSNNVLRSTLHRVVAPAVDPNAGEDAKTPSRQSIAFFCNPNFTQKIECIPTCVGEVGPKYPPIGTEEYIVSRLKDTYN